MISKKDYWNLNTKLILTFLLCFQFTSGLFSQNYHLPANAESGRILERLSVLNGLDHLWHSDIRSWNRIDMAEITKKLDSLNTSSNNLISSDIQYLIDDNNEFFPKKKSRSSKAIAKHFYKTPANFFEFDNKDLQLRINPILNVDYSISDVDDNYFTNARGLSLRGRLDKKIFFYSEIVENQARFPNYVRSYIFKNNTVPNANRYKQHTSNIFNTDQAQDFLTAQGYLAVQVSEHFDISLGHGDHFVGNGMRSLLLSDFASNYFYLKLNAKVWKFQYQSIFAELNPVSPLALSRDGLLPKKYMATHYLSVNLGKKVSIGLFESVVLARPNHFELQYLNPVILYRVVEHGLGSPDNVLIGLNGKYTPTNKIQLYGQLMLDELKVKELFNGNGWWANKFGIQAGAKYFEMFGIKNLDGQIEMNVVRPYTYTHRDSISNYAHANQALAHPLGANFSEIVFNIHYQAKEKWSAYLQTFIIKQGIDQKQTNYGSDILLPNTSRTEDYGIDLFQGIESKTMSIYSGISYQVFHNTFLDFNMSMREQKEVESGNKNKLFYVGFGIRMNAARRKYAF